MREQAATMKGATPGGPSKADYIPVGYKRTRIGVIPGDWEVRTLGALGEFKNGINKDKQDFGHGFPFVNLMDVFGISKISTSSSIGLVNSSLGEREAYALQSGDVLFVRSSVKPEGVGLTTLILEDLPNTVFSGFLIRYRAKEAFALEFKEHCFQEAGFRNRLIASSTVSANTNINQESLESLALSLPRNKSEQRAIAAVLSDVDELIGSLEALIAKKRAIKQAAMQELLTGRTRVPGLGGEWEDGQLGTIAKMVSGGTPSTSVAAYWSGGIPWITGADILGQSVANIRRHITEEAVEGSPTSIVAKGNLLVVSRTGVGKLAIAPFDVAISQDFTGVVPNRDKLSSRFLFRYLDFCQHVLTNQNQGTSIKGITRDALAEVLVPLPPLPEQRAIATVLSDMDAEIAALERRLDKTRAIKQGMMQQLLTGSIRLPIPDDDTEDDDAHDA